jgi:hypothetical protein
MYHSKTKHFEIHLNYARDMDEKKKVKISYILTKCQVANLLTKGLSNVKFENCVKLCNPSIYFNFKTQLSKFLKM